MAFGDRGAFCTKSEVIRKWSVENADNSGNERRSGDRTSEYKENVDLDDKGAHSTSGCGSTSNISVGQCPTYPFLVR
jgi:hypothetical protein